MMSIYESMALAQANEHGRGLFTGKGHNTKPYGFQSKFFRWLLIAYGEGLYELPRTMGLDPIGSAGRKLPWNFPAFTIAQTMKTGIAPSEAMQYPTMGGFEHQYTPIHLGTALLKFGHDVDRTEADKLLSLTFLKKVCADKAANAFASHSYINPYKPEDVGRAQYDAELLVDTKSAPYVLDELGNAAWFPDEYLRAVLHTVESAHWYSRLCQLHVVHGRWKPMLESAAYALLTRGNSARKTEYRSATNYLRNLTPGQAAAYRKQLTGVREILLVVRADTPPEHMARGLKALVTNQNTRTEEVMRYIGRPLTLDDLRPLKPKVLLDVLYYLPYAAIEEVATTRREELASMLFTLTDAKSMPLLMNSMVPHASRERKWIPDTPAGNVQVTSMSEFSAESVQKTWDDHMKPLIDDYDRAKQWRDELVQHAPPEVLFLSLMRWGPRGSEEAPVADVALENVLRSYPTITEVQNVLNAMPETVGRLGSL